MVRSQLVVAAVVIALTASIAAADEPACPRPWTVNLELFGRSGLWGLGVERELGDRYYVGGVGSFTPMRGDHAYALSPYGGLRLRGTRHVWRADLGLTLVHVRTPSPVPEWDGDTRTGVSVVAGSGYEYRGRVRLRASALLLAGKGGIAPWLALSVGLPF